MCLPSVVFPALQGDVNVAKVDVPSNSALASRFDIKVSGTLIHSAVFSLGRNLTYACAHASPHSLARLGHRRQKSAH